MTDIDLQPLLDTLPKITDGRILPYAEVTKDAAFCRAKIPVKEINTGDKTDRAIRRYLADQIKLQSKKLGVEARFEQLRPGTSWFDDDENEYPLQGLIHLSWWPRPEPKDFDVLKKQQRTWKGNRPD